eukprot:10884885-Ditylum_brightwellii.AAC.1
MFCIKCYGEEALAPLEISNENEVSNVQDLQEELLEEGIELPANTTNSEIEEYYETCITQ